MALARPNQLRTIQAVRVGLAAAIALLVSESWHLPRTNLAVWTTHMIMTSHSHTTFQKGLERILGRGSGILIGGLIVAFLGELTPLVLVLEVAGMLAFFYAHFCGRLAYTYLNGGIYLNAVIMLNVNRDPGAAYSEGGWLFLAIVVGVVVSYLVTWLTFGERDLSIDPGAGYPLWPLRGESLARAAQMVATTLGAQYAYFALDLPPDSNTLALFLLSVIPDLHATLENGRFFRGGILLATFGSIPAVLLLNRLPHLPLLVLVVGGALFLASYIGQSKSGWGAVGSEFGQIFTLLVVVPAAQVASPASTLYNIASLYVFMLIALVNAHLWVALGLVTPERSRAA